MYYAKQNIDKARGKTGMSMFHRMGLNLLKNASSHSSKLTITQKIYDVNRMDENPTRYAADIFCLTKTGGKSLSSAVTATWSTKLSRRVVLPKYTLNPVDGASSTSLKCWSSSK